MKNKKVIYLDTPIFSIDKDGAIIKGETHNVGSAWRKDFIEVEQEFNGNKKSKFLCIYAPNKMLRPYYTIISTLTAENIIEGTYESDVKYSGWGIRYIILDKDLNVIKKTQI